MTALDDPVDLPHIVLSGIHVALGPLHRGLLPHIWRWENNPRTVELGGDEFRPRTFDQVKDDWEPVLRGERANWAGFAIYALPDYQPIGLLNVRDFHGPNHTAEYGIQIGEPTERGKGYGTEATSLALRFAFETLSVHNVWLDTISSNIAAIHAYKRAGFREIGRLREARRIGGRVVDLVLMDCLATEWATNQQETAEPSAERPLNR